MSENCEHYLTLYNINCTQLIAFNRIIWQFPAALMTINLVGLNFFLDNVVVILILVLFNTGSLVALARHIKTSKAIIDASIEIEAQLRKFFDRSVPVFERPRIKSTTIIFVLLIFFNISLFAYALYNLYVSLVPSH